MLKKALSSTAIIFAAVLLLGCAPGLQRPDAPEAEVQAERTAQIRLAKEIRAKRLARLNGLKAKLTPQARDICAKALGKSGLECIYSFGVG